MPITKRLEIHLTHSHAPPVRHIAAPLGRCTGRREPSEFARVAETFRSEGSRSGMHSIAPASPAGRPETCERRSDLGEAVTIGAGAAME
jgi:hypothetical protein